MLAAFIESFISKSVDWLNNEDDDDDDNDGLLPEAIIALFLLLVAVVEISSDSGTIMLFSNAVENKKEIKELVLDQRENKTWL